MDVSKVGQIQGAAPQPPDKSKVAPKAKSTVSADRVEISASAKNVKQAASPQPFVNLAKAALDIRQEKVEEVKAKMIEGAYNTREASVKAAEAILKEISG